MYRPSFDIFVQGGVTFLAEGLGGGGGTYSWIRHCVFVETVWSV